MISLFFFLLLIQCFLMYTSHAPRAPYAFNDILTTNKKKYCSQKVEILEHKISSNF